jgi:simple sugar transport system permease protein
MNYQGQLKKALVPFVGSLLSIGFGLFAVAAFLYVTGRNPLSIYNGMLVSAFGDSFALSETLVAATPIMFCALAVSIGTRVGLLNIGVEGQLLAGAAGATVVALNLPPQTQALPMLSLMCLSAVICGAAWSGIAGVLKVFLQVNETIVSLLLNYVAVLLIDYLIHGPWQDPTSTSWPQTQAFPESAELLHLAGSRIHLGLPIAIAIGLVLALFWSTTKAGFKSRVIGENIEAARYAHYHVKTYLLVAMLVSGMVAALAGFAQVSAIEGRLRSGLSPGYGYSGFLVCFLARHNPIAIIVVAILLGGFLSGADSLQLTEKLPFATVNIMQGAIFLFLLASENFFKKLSNKGSTT